MTKQKIRETPKAGGSYKRDADTGELVATGTGDNRKPKQFEKPTAPHEENGGNVAVTLAKRDAARADKAAKEAEAAANREGAARSATEVGTASNPTTQPAQTPRTADTATGSKSTQTTGPATSSSRSSAPTPAARGGSRSSSGGGRTR